MNRTFLAAIASLASLTLGQAAHATDKVITITASVNSFCKISGSTSNSTDTASFTVSEGDVTVAAVNKTYPIVCNKAADLTLTSANGALTAGLSSVSGFAHLIDYTAAASGFASATLNTSTTATATGPETATGSSSGPGASNLSLAITPISNGATPLQAGSYSDTLTVTIVPQ